MVYYVRCKWSLIEFRARVSRLVYGELLIYCDILKNKIINILKIIINIRNTTSIKKTSNSGNYQVTIATDIS